MLSGNAFDKVLKNVKKIREPGEGPEESMESMDSYLCDLCKDEKKPSEIIQCGFCGRWVCKEGCWGTSLKACESCSGLILLARGDAEKDQEE